MAIDFGGVLITDNYQTAFVPKLQELQKGLACLLDPAYITYTGAPYTGAKRINNGLFEEFNGTSWAVKTMGYVRIAGAETVTGAKTFSGGLISTLLSSPASTGAALGPGGLSIYNSALTTNNRRVFTSFDATNGFALGFNNDAASASTIAWTVTGGQAAGITGQSWNTTTGQFSWNVNGSQRQYLTDSSGSTKAWFGTSLTTDGAFAQAMLATGRANTWSNFQITNAAGGSAAYLTENFGSAVNAKYTDVDSHYFRSAAGATQLQVSATAGATRYVTITGSNGGNPTIGTSAGQVALSSALRTTVTANTGNDVSSVYSLLTQDKLMWVDSARTANNKQVEFRWSEGIFRGWFVDDIYNGVAQWLGVTGGQGLGVTQLSLYAGASIEMMRLTAAGMKIGSASAAARKLDVAGGAMTTPLSVAYSATPAIDASASNVFFIGTLTGNVSSLTISGGLEGQFLTVRFRQDGTGGRTVSLPGISAAGAISLSPNKTSYLSVTYNATAALWEGSWTQIP